MSDAVRPTQIFDQYTIEDGLTDEQIAAHVQRWLDELRTAPTVDVEINAAELLDEIYADGEL